MVAFIASLLLTAALIGIVVVVAGRRSPGTPLTWGEAFVAGTFVFGIMLLAYAIVPNQWLLFADNELKWRSDVFGIPYFPGRRAFENGISFGDRGRIMVPLQVTRDVIVTLIYVVALGGQVAAWAWWQKRGKAKPATPEIERSAFGRPLVRKV